MGAAAEEFVFGQVSSVQLAALGPACAICDAISGLMVCM